jgi:hypothetical protein
MYETTFAHIEPSSPVVRIKAVRKPATVDDPFPTFRGIWEHLEHNHKKHLNPSELDRLANRGYKNHRLGRPRNALYALAFIDLLNGNYPNIPDKKKRNNKHV